MGAAGAVRFGAPVLMSLTEQMNVMLPALEAELRQQLARLDEPAMTAFHEMLAYHMGWTGENSGTGATGKRIRPLLLLLVAASCGGQWRHALPAAAAVEIVHNFSLVHDDIQDNSSMRHGRPAVWKKYGAAMAINVGDALYALSDHAIIDLSRNYPAEMVVAVAATLHTASLNLTRGQYLDMSYQKRADLSIRDYWPMIAGKTAALLEASTRIGAMLGGADAGRTQQFGSFGHCLGLAFQAQDDILGIWGDETLTGKSAASDLLEGKNSLPVLYGLSQKGGFAQRWKGPAIRPEEVEELAQMLRHAGAYDYSQREAQRLIEEALDALEKASPRGEAGQALRDLAGKLLQRAS